MCSLDRPFPSPSLAIAFIGCQVVCATQELTSVFGNHHFEMPIMAAIQVKVVYKHSFAATSKSQHNMRGICRPIAYSRPIIAIYCNSRRLGLRRTACRGGGGGKTQHGMVKIDATAAAAEDIHDTYKQLRAEGKCHEEEEEEQ